MSLLWNTIKIINPFAVNIIAFPPWPCLTSPIKCSEESYFEVEAICTSICSTQELSERKLTAGATLKMFFTLNQFFTLTKLGCLVCTTLHRKKCA